MTCEFYADMCFESCPQLLQFLILFSIHLSEISHHEIIDLTITDDGARIQFVAFQEEIQLSLQKVSSTDFMPENLPISVIENNTVRSFNLKFKEVYICVQFWILMDFHGKIIDLFMFSFMYLTVFPLISSFLNTDVSLKLVISHDFIKDMKTIYINVFKCLYTKHLYKDERIMFQHGIEFYQEVGGLGIFSIQCSSFNNNACRIVSSH